MRTLSLAAALCLALGVAGCGDTTTSRTLSGGAIGAAGGTVVGAAAGAAAGNTLAGTAIGAGAGLVGGYLYDQHKKGNID